MPASRSLIALLVGTAAFFALWIVALKPGSSTNSSGTPSSQGLKGYESDINKAKQAVGISNASNAASGNLNATSSSGGATVSHPSAPPASTPKATSQTKTATQATGSSAQSNALTTAELELVKASLSSHKVVALLFFNPLAADDRAVLGELALVPTHKGHVMKLAVPLSQAASFTAVTQQVPLNFSPTLVLISPTDHVNEIVGYTDSFEIDQRVDQALAVG